MTRLSTTTLAAATLVLALAPAGWAETIAFKLLPNPSRATFKTDAPLETIVGNTSAAGIQGTLTVDPARPQAATGTVRVDMNTVRTGIDKRDADMRSKDFLDTEVEANRWVTFEVKGVDIAGPLVPGKGVPARIRGVLTVKNRPVERTAEAVVTWIKLTPEQLESQRRLGFTADNIKVRAKFTTTFTDHGMQVPQLLFLKLADLIEMETDLTFVRAQ